MNVSNNGGQNYYTTSNLRIGKSSAEHLASAQSKAKTSTNKAVVTKETVADDLYIPEERLKKQEYAQYVKEYSDGLTNGNGLFGSFIGNSLEDMYKYAMEQFEKIENSSESKETKDMRRTALEDLLKETVDMFVFTKSKQHYKLAPPNRIEKNNSTMAEMRDFQRKQFKAVANSARKLTLNFFNYIKNTSSFNFDAMIIHINKGSSNNGDANNLSLDEINGFF